MRRAGYEVRVLAGEGDSFEQNPPTLIEYIRRDLRWCQGNMQYWHFLRLPGLRPVSRYQLIFAILMFIGAPAWIGMLFLGSVAVAMAPTPADFMRFDAGIVLLLLVLAMWFAPNIATVIDIMSRADLRRSFGGGVRFVLSFVLTDRVRHRAVIGAMGEPHGVPGAAADGPRHRLGRADARRPCAVLDRRGAILLAADADRRGAGAAPGRHRACRDPLRAVHRRRTAVLDPVRGLDVEPGGRPRPDRSSGSTGCPRKPRRRRNCARLALPAIELTLAQTPQPPRDRRRTKSPQVDRDVRRRRDLPSARACRLSACA